MSFMIRLGGATARQPNRMPTDAVFGVAKYFSDLVLLQAFSLAQAIAVSPLKRFTRLSFSGLSFKSMHRRSSNATIDTRGRSLDLPIFS